MLWKSLTLLVEIFYLYMGIRLKVIIEFLTDQNIFIVYVKDTIFMISIF